jgi:hypothetical protein
MSDSGGEQPVRFRAAIGGKRPFVHMAGQGATLPLPGGLQPGRFGESGAGKRPFVQTHVIGSYEPYYWSS